MKGKMERDTRTNTTNIVKLQQAPDKLFCNRLTKVIKQMSYLECQ